MNKVPPKVGQVWGVGTFSDAVSEIDDSYVYFEDGADVLKAEFYNFYKFKPQNDLEWLAINIDLSEWHDKKLYMVRRGDNHFEFIKTNMYRNSSYSFQQHQDKRNELFGVEPVMDKVSQEEFDKGMRQSMQKIALLVGCKFGVDAGYEDLPNKVESAIQNYIAEITSLLPEVSKPKMKVEYFKCEFKHAWEAVKAFEELGEFHQYLPHGYEQITSIECAFDRHLRGNLYRKVETPVTWQSELEEFVNKSPWLTDIHNLGDFYPELCSGASSDVDAEFIEMCRLVVKHASDKD